MGRMGAHSQSGGVRSAGRIVSFQQTINDFGERLLDAVESSRNDLKVIVSNANTAIGSAEASILVLTDSKTHLRFLVSLNDALDNGDVEIERHKAFSGFVFDSGQIIAKVKPDSEGAGEVDKKAGVRTDYLLSVPIMSDQRVIAVGTFVNRAEGSSEEGFMKDELDLAQQFADLYATGLKVHRQAVIAYQLACEQLVELACEMEIDMEELECLKHKHSYASGFEESVFAVEQKLSPPDREMWRRFGDFLLQDGEEEFSD